jgi:hypothetical protein
MRVLAESARSDRQIVTRGQLVSVSRFKKSAGSGKWSPTTVFACGPCPPTPLGTSWTPFGQQFQLLEFLLQPGKDEAHHSRIVGRCRGDHQQMKHLVVAEDQRARVRAFASIDHGPR